jgi:CubicO group peptidase (beta-lactamase class C family)
MVMEHEYPGTAQALIADYVTECGDSWSGVTIEHALDMTTGHFSQPTMHGDEDMALGGEFFLSQTHDGKIHYACHAHPRKADPGQHLSYHSWDTYLAGTAINARLRSIEGEGADFYRDLLVEKIWKPLGLSMLAMETRRTYDDIAQPYSGYGVTLVRDDVARLLQFLGPDDGRIDGRDVFDRKLFDAVKLPTAEDPGMTAELDAIRYNNGFRSFDVSTYIGCDSPVWVVTMSGFGGINFVLMPNDTAYYYFSDGNVHRYLTAVRESHAIRPMCGTGSAESVQ